MDQRNPDITAASVTKMKPQKSKSVSLATDEIYIIKSHKASPRCILYLSIKNGVQI
jgi:hypothetical protein